MRLAIVSDIHGNLPALEAILGDIRTRAVDAIVNLGDCVSAPLWPRETLELIQSAALPTVRGNHDRWAASDVEPDSATVAFTREALTSAQRGWLGALPTSIQVANDILAVHGTPRSDAEYLLEERIDGRLALARRPLLDERLGDTRARLILCGHSHLQHTAMTTGDRLIVNPGSVGCPRYAGNDDPFIAEAGSPHARYAIATQGRYGWRVELFAIEYDWDPVVAQARANGREDWAIGFLQQR